MKTKKNTASKLPDIVVVLICLAGILISLWMFWKDLNTTLTREETAVGEIYFKRKYAQRKFDDRVVWDRLQQLSPVYDGDTIRTAALSQAVITLKGQESIELSDSSIIQIMVDDDGNRMLTISGGNINIDTHNSSESFTLVSGGNEIAVGAGSRINIQSNSAGENISLTVMEGSASLTGEQGTVAMDAGSALKVHADGTSESILTLVDIIAYPDSYASALSPANIPVQFFWNTEDVRGEIIRLELAKDHNFSAIHQSVDIADGNNTTLVLDSAGAYYWRIYPLGAEIENASAGKFNLAYSQTPKLTAPAEGFSYNYRTKQPAVRMYWESENPDAWYQVEIANNPQMNNPEVMLVQESSMVNSALNAGDWYWRVTPIYPSGFLVNKTPSSIGHFRIEQGGALQAPNLIVPASGAVVNIAEQKSSAYFSWKRDSEAAFYTIQISASENLENPIISHQVTDNYFAYSIDQHALQAGAYYWAVYQTDSEGNQSPLSESRPFSATEEEIEYTTIFPPDNYAVAENRLPDTVFTWKSSLSVPNRFQVSTNDTFTNLIVDQTTNASRYPMNTIPAGDYYWRIVAETDSGAPPLSSPAKKLTVVGSLGAPKAINPASGTSLVLRTGGELDFTWEKVDEADYYQFKLFRGDQPIFENLFAEDSSQSFSMDRLQQGAYRWTVQAFVEDENATLSRESLIASNALTVTELQPVRLDYPAGGHRYEGLAALNNPDSVRWSSVEPVGSSRFILSTNANPLANPRSIIVDTRNPGNTIKLPSLGEGTY
ncbi:MAG: FecR family protein, partial [Treponema sp.]|nr:FecR family protein [Treponema sp.]